MTTPASWSSPSRSRACDENPRLKAPLKKYMSDLDNRIVAESAQGWTMDEHWYKRFLHRSRPTATSFQDELLLLEGQSSRSLPEENPRTKYQTPVGVQYPSTAYTKTNNYQAYCAGWEAAARDQAQNQTLIGQQLSTEENANTSFYARILGTMPPPSSSSAAALQIRSENNYSEALFNPAVFTSRRPQLALNNNQAETSNSQCIDTIKGIRTNSSAPLSLRAKVQSPQHAIGFHIGKYQAPYGTNLPCHGGKSFSGGTDISSCHNRLPYNTCNEVPSIHHHSRSLSLPEIFRSTGPRSEPENLSETFPKPVLDPSTNFFLQRSFVTEAIPSVTVVFEGRSICQRICLQEHTNYDSFARALRGMFGDSILTDDQKANYADDCNLTNAIPGYLIAYEDIEGDLLLAGDLSWQDFVRAAKRIRILRAKDPQGRVRKRE